MSGSEIDIDGSRGEGGGQILRTSLGLSLVTGRPFRIVNIRAGRAKPGLMRQHLTAVQAAARVGCAEVAGAEIGSKELTFRPGAVNPGHYEFAVGSAGSATLVLQTVLPALLTANGPPFAPSGASGGLRPSTLVLEGGTHNPFAPPFDFLAKTFLPLVNRMGPTVTVALQRPGFYPAGGGKFTVKIEPSARLTPIDLPDRGEIRRRRARAVVAGLPRNIADRELKVVAQKLGWSPAELEVDEAPAARDPGNVLMLEIESGQVTEVITAFGEKGVSAEAVAERAVDEARAFLAADVPVGEHLADQLLLPMALAGGGSFRTTALSKHARTNIEVVRMFLPVRMDVAKDDSGSVVVHVAPMPAVPTSGIAKD